MFDRDHLGNSIAAVVGVVVAVVSVVVVFVFVVVAVVVRCSLVDFHLIDSL